MNTQRSSFKQSVIFLLLFFVFSSNGFSQLNCVKSPDFTYQKWFLKGWGVGIYDDTNTGPDAFDHKIRIIRCNTTFTLKEIADAWVNGHQFGVWMEGPVVDTYRNSNKQPLYVFGYILTKPDDVIGKSASSRQNNYSYNDGVIVFPFDTKTAGQHSMELMLRERDNDYWAESSWVGIGRISITVTP